MHPLDADRRKWEYEAPVEAQRVNGLTVRGEQIYRLKKQKMDRFEWGMDCVLPPPSLCLPLLKKGWVIVIGIMQINHSHADVS